MDPKTLPAVYDYISLVPKAYVSVVCEQIPIAKRKSNRNAPALTLSYVLHGTWPTQDRQHYPSPTTLAQPDWGKASNGSSWDLLRTASLEASISSLALQHCAVMLKQLLFFLVLIEQAWVLSTKEATKLALLL